MPNRQRLFAATLCLLHWSHSGAEVVVDGSLGVAGPLSGPDFAITPDLGQQFGGNLFHSFSAFNINTGESASFSGPGSVTNIVSRVTGGGSSTINGALNSSIAGANLYFMNPNGVMFGSGAQLNISGSFHVTTANSIALGSDGVFLASLGGSSALTASPPSAFGFTAPNPGEVSVDETLLQVPDGQAISVVAGDITLSNGRLVAKSGDISLTSVAAPGDVLPGAQGTMVVNVDELGTIEITDTRPFDTIGNIDVAGNISARTSSGNIYIRAGALRSYGGFFHSNSFGDQDGGATDIHVDGELVLSQNTFVDGSGNDAFKSTTMQNDSALGSGNAADITLTSGSMRLDGFSGITSDGDGAGDSGNITITTGDMVIDDGRIASILGNTGTGGNVVVIADTLSMTGTGAIRTNTRGDGSAGNIEVNAGSLYMQDLATLDASVRPGAAGDGGTIRVTGNDLTILSAPNQSGLGAKIAVDTFGSGNGGDIEIQMSSVTLLNQAVIEARSRPDATGTAGDITLTGLKELRIEGGSAISTQTESADGGNIDIQASDLVYLLDSEIRTSVQGGLGSGGNITIDPTFVVLSDGNIIANAFGGNGGNITIVADTLIATPSSTIQASSQLGIDGTVNVDAPESDVSSGISTLPAVFQDRGDLLSDQCGRRADIERSTFGVSGRGGLPASPEDYQPASGMLPDHQNSDSGLISLAAQRVDRVAPTVACGGQKN